MNSLRIGLLQLDTQWENPLSNQSAIEQIIQTEKNLDLIILPEMFLTGFSCNQLEITIEESQQQIKWMKEISNKSNTHIIGSLKIKDELGLFKNRMILTSPQKPIQFYDKRHLFSLSTEASNFSKGLKQQLFNINNWSIFPQICYDLRFPVWSRNKFKYDLLINVANWPSVRQYAWRSLLIARAIENQCYVIGVNRIGTDYNQLTYSGDSLVIDPKGQILLDAKDSSSLLKFEIDMSDIIKTREALPFLHDMDNFDFIS